MKVLVVSDDVQLVAKITGVVLARETPDRSMVGGRRLRYNDGEARAPPAGTCSMIASIRSFSPTAAGLVALAVATAILSPGRGVQAAVVEAPHVRAQLVGSVTGITPGRPFRVGLHLKLDPGWHVYWKNPGDAGTPTTLDWDLPDGFRAGPLEWPTPHRIPLGGLVNYGYEDELLLPVTLTPPANAGPGPVTLKVRASWLVCEEMCLPGEADLELVLPVVPGEPGPDPAWTEAFEQAALRAPAALPGSAARFREAQGRLTLEIDLPAGVPVPAGAIHFFPDAGDVIEHGASPSLDRDGSRLTMSLPVSEYSTGLPELLEGDLAAAGGFGSTGRHSIRIRAVRAGDGSPGTGAGTGTAAGMAAGTGTETGTGTGTGTETGSGTGTGTGVGVGRSGAGGTAGTLAGSGTATPGSGPGPTRLTGDAGDLTLGTALVFAFLGGLILNLMPCVFPVLTLKILSFVKQAGDQRSLAVGQSLVFSLGILVSFWALAGLLLLLRSGGQELGWGFQLQSPVFVVLMIFLFFLLGLNLLGTFEVGAGVTRLAGSLASSTPGHAGAFGSGVLATLVATPCTAPFMGSALGYALTLPAGASLMVFTALGLGMALPYVILSASPRLLDLLPRPGAWMETFKQFLAFPLLATIVWLSWVLGQQAGLDAVIALEGALILLGLAAWIHGRLQRRPASGLRGLMARTAALLSLGLALWVGLPMEVRPSGAPGAAIGPGGLVWQPFAPGVVDELRRSGRPVYVDFTAAWCLTCQVNKKLVFGSARVRERFAELGVALVRADWTSKNPAITEALASFGRSGVPLNVLYPADPAGEPVVLPTVLHAGLVLEALDGLTTR